MKTKYTIIFALAASALTQNVQAGFERGNGGNGIKIGSNIYLLDLVEAGTESAPYFDPTSKADPADVKIVEDSLSFIDSATSHLFARKLGELRSLDPLSAWAVILGVNSYEWSLVNPALISVGDEETTLQLDPTQIVQLAVRSGRRILIHRDNWNQITPDQRAALIFHEIIYALMKPQELMTTDPVSKLPMKYSKQSSPDAREIVGYLFSPVSAHKRREGFLKIARDRIPTFDHAQFVKTLPLYAGFEVLFNTVENVWSGYCTIIGDTEKSCGTFSFADPQTSALSICEKIAKTPVTLNLDAHLKATDRMLDANSRGENDYTQPESASIYKGALEFKNFKGLAGEEREWLYAPSIKDLGDRFSSDGSDESTFTVNAPAQCVMEVSAKIKDLKDALSKGFEPL